MRPQSFLVSTLLQTIAVAILFLTASSPVVQRTVTQVATLVAPADLVEVLSPPKARVNQGGGGGGDRSPLPASKGRLPKAALRQFVPPAEVLNNPAPKLAMEPSILAPPDLALPSVDMAVYGDPLGKLGPPSNGQGSGGGIGSGKGGGVGSGRGGGVGPGEGGGIGGGIFAVGGGITNPVILFQPEPEYSTEARKAMLQGTVVLEVVVDVSGKTRNIKLLRSLGLGLDEEAMKAVEKWRFKPAMKDGKPVAVIINAFVGFHLL
jgi:TonB family protein